MRRDGVWRRASIQLADETSGRRPAPSQRHNLSRLDELRARELHDPVGGFHPWELPSSGRPRSRNEGRRSCIVVRARRFSGEYADAARCRRPRSTCWRRSPPARAICRPRALAARVTGAAAGTAGADGCSTVLLGSSLCRYGVAYERRVRTEIPARHRRDVATGGFRHCHPRDPLLYRVLGIRTRHRDNSLGKRSAPAGGHKSCTLGSVHHPFGDILPWLVLALIGLSAHRSEMGGR